MKAAESVNGIVQLLEQDIPECTGQSLVVKMEYSAISSGTELMLLKAKGNVRLGNSGTGMVISKGRHVKHVDIGQRVAIYGVPTHAEYVAVPKNLAVPVPPGVDSKEAAFAGLGAIAIHALRQADLRFGESAVVVGLGILGQIIAQIADAAANLVFATDLLEARCRWLAQIKPSCLTSADIPELEEMIQSRTQGAGADCVLLCAGSQTDTLIDQGIDWLRDRGKIVIVGMPNPAFTRNKLFAKEAEIVISRAGGPGRYDPAYEQDGFDYPLGHVRWTEGRNTAEFVRLLADKRIHIEPLISHTFAFADIAEAYQTCLDSPQETMGMLIQYG